jgi:hypothetical protein
LLVHVFPGADGRFELYDDEGNSNTYLDGAYAITPMRQAWQAKSGSERTVVTIGPAQGALEYLPAQRRFDLLFRGFNQPASVAARLNGASLEVEALYQPETHTFTLPGLTLKPTDTLEVTLVGAAEGLANRADARLSVCMSLLKHFHMETNAKALLANSLADLLDDPSKLGRYLTRLTPSQQRALLEVLTGAGSDYTESTGDPLLVMWNNHGDERITQLFSVARTKSWWLQPEWANNLAPRFIAYRPKVDFGERALWMVQMNYFGETTVKFEGK